MTLFCTLSMSEPTCPSLSSNAEPTDNQLLSGVPVRMLLQNTPGSDGLNKNGPVGSYICTVFEKIIKIGAMALLE